MSTSGRKTKKKPIKKINHTMKNKLSILFLCVLGALVILLGVITYINFQSGEKYKKQVLSQAQQKYQNRTIPAKRGSISDRNGNLLAISNKVYNVVLDCKTTNSDADYVEPTIRALVDILGAEEDKVREALTSEETRESQYQVVKKAATMDQQKAFEEYCDLSDTEGMTEAEIKERKNVKGVWFEEDYQRVYPYNELACDTIGFTFSRDTADYGLEGYYNSTLVGIDGRQYGYLNDDSTVEQTIIEASNGNNLETSLDLGIQQIVENGSLLLRNPQAARILE